MSLLGGTLNFWDSGGLEGLVWQGIMFAHVVMGALLKNETPSLQSPHGGDGIEEVRVRVWRKKSPAGFRKGWGLRLGRMETAGNLQCERPEDWDGAVRGLGVFSLF